MDDSDLDYSSQWRNLITALSVEPPSQRAVLRSELRHFYQAIDSLSAEIALKAIRFLLQGLFLPSPLLQKALFLSYFLEMVCNFCFIF